MFIGIFAPLFIPGETDKTDKMLPNPGLVNHVSAILLGELT